MSTASLRTAMLIAFLAATLPAYAIIVRGTVTTALGVPLGNARVQLIQGRQVAAFAFTLPDGTYEIRSSVPGRFLLLTSAAPFTPSIGHDFYGGRTDVITRNVVMEYATVTAQVTAIATGLSTPVEQLSSPVTLIPEAALANQTTLLNDLRQSLGVEVVQTGQTGSPAALYVRGGSPTANKILLDGIATEDIGGRFDFGTLSTTALTGIGLYRGSNSALFGANAAASVVQLETFRGNTLRPVLNYTGDAGNFHTYRNEVALSGAHGRFDYLAAFSRFDTSNALPLDRHHLTTSTANLGYSLLTNTQIRFTLRNAGSTTGLPDAHDLYGLSASGKQADQDIYSGLTIENQFAGNLHTTARYAITRKREQVGQFTPVGQPVTTQRNGLPTTIYYGNQITLRGANGYTATGQAAFLSPSFDQVSNRDELAFQTSYTFPFRIAALFGFLYENERGRLLNLAAATDEQTHRTNLLYTLQLQGDLKHRLFYNFGGALEKNHLYGISGTPRLGLAYTPVRPGTRIFRGTSLRANAAIGVAEPSLTDEFTSLFTELHSADNQAAITAYKITPLTAQRSRTFDLGIDQNILNQKLILKAGYFHNQFNHQLESIAPTGLEQYFGIPAILATQSATLNSLAFRTQGLETEVRYQPLRHLSINGGYTYLASLVQQSFSNDASSASNGHPTINPNLPGIPIGALSPLVGSRPFRRPPGTGFFVVQYTTTRFSTALKGAFSSRSDDSTFQLANDLHHTNTLLLPNRNLDFGYTKLDINVLFAVTGHITAFTQLDNLLGQQHIGPIGYPGLPFTVRAGLKIRIGGN